VGERGGRERQGRKEDRKIPHQWLALWTDDVATL
jgi:hypothetical protein